MFLAFNRHSHSPHYTYHSELWADRAGYFVYLPAAFKHRFDPKRFPTGIDTLTGHGFKLDQVNGKVVTKYTYGVALLQSPFYLLAHGMSYLLGGPAEAFGPLDHAIVNVAGPIYGITGILLVFLIIRERYGEKIAMVTASSIYLGTNLFYYTVADPGMSHVYSFFLFASWLFLLKQLIVNNTRSLFCYITLGVIAGTIILIRPTNAIFLLITPALFRYFSDDNSAYRGIRDALIRTDTIWAIGAAVLVWLPQMAYWQSVHGTPMAWSYENEGFTFWDSPKLLEFWFSPNNGLLPYTPMIVLVIAGLFKFLSTPSRLFSVATFGSFLMISYLGAAWWVWHFGCGLGSRTMVEFWALFAIPLASWIQGFMKRMGPIFPLMILGAMAIHQLKITYSYDGCWHTGIWDWQTYVHLIFGPTK